jgi:hypothetical protein
MKKLLFFSLSGAAAIALIISGINPFQSEEHVAVYKPRSAQLHTATFGAQGAMDFQREMKKNFFTGQVEASDIIESRRALKKYSADRAKSNDMEWSTLGPDNIGGRTRALWLNPQNNNHLIGGGVSGGLWQTFNAGNSWQPIQSFNRNEDFFQHMPIASINRTGSGIYYVGTGSQHEYFNWSGAGTAGFIGGGLFRSTNTEGTDWELVFGPDQLFNTNQSWITVDRIMVDPNNPEKMWIAHNRGLDVYIHGNADLEPRPSGLPVTAQSCEDVQISHDGQVIVASINRRGYISTNGGQNFSPIGGNLTNGESNILGAGNNSRVQFAISPTDPDYIYGVVVNQNQSLRGVIASFNRGNTWTRIAADVNSSTPNQPVPFQPFGGVGGQGTWDCAISVNPLDPKHIFLGGLVIYSHKIVGNVPAPSNWEQRSLYSTNYLNPFAVHPDIHWFVWDSNNVFYACTDGGFFKSNTMATAESPTFYPANQGYVTTQFYGIDHANDDRTIGGTQDNGTLYQNQMGVTPNQGLEVFGGDGFDCAISAVRPNLLFGSSQNGVIYRSLGVSFGEVISPNQSNDFTTDLRLIETEEDPYSTRGHMWGVDTIFDAFVSEIQEWPNGDITLGYIPAGFWIMHNSSADQRELWTQTEEDMYFYAQSVQCDSIFIPYLDTTEVIIEVTLIDSILTPIDTTYIFTCDTVSMPVDTTYAFLCDTLSIPMDTTFVDTCILFQQQIFCVTIDTTYNNFQDTLFCVVSDSTILYQDSLICAVTDTIIGFDIEYVYDTTFTYVTEEMFDVFVDCETLFNFSDSLLLIDPVQSLLAVGLGLGNGIWVTRDALNTGIDPEWWLVNNTTQMVNALEWSPDRNHLYIGTTNGQLIRISGFNQVYYASDLDNLTTHTLINSGAPITDIAVDYSQGTGGPDGPPASSMVVVTRATYGTHDKVLRSNVAATTTSANSFSNIWNITPALNRMPAFSCLIEKSDPNIILVGTELGVFRTENGGTTWIEANGGMMDRVPVFDIRQQYLGNWKVENSGVIYAGTHGRGIFRNGEFFEPVTSVGDNLNQDALITEAVSNMTIFPNPMNTNGWVDFKLNQAGDVRVTIFNINGQIVENIVREKLPEGEHQIGFDATRLAAGTYVLTLETGGVVKNGRFVVTK